jgi:hypothetical protein
MDARRTRALIRDEGRLRAALAEHENRRFDLDTALTVKYRVEDLLETVSLIVQDNDFWTRLTDVNRPPSHLQLDRIRQLDPLAFAALLEAAGYTSPPPPPVDELVDDTIRALVTAVTSSRDVGIDRVGGARWQLQTLVIRVRRQISEQEVPELAPSVLRSSARSLGRAARWLIPRVVAATAGAVVEAHAPGSGLGFFVGRSVKRVAEDASELVAEMVMGDPSPAPATVSAEEPGWTDIDPLTVHLAALTDQLKAVAYPAPDENPCENVQYVRQIASEARRHLNRIEEVANDLDCDTIGVAEKIQAIRRALDALSQIIRFAEEPPFVGYAPPVIAQKALDEVGELREELPTRRVAPATHERYDGPPTVY